MNLSFNRKAKCINATAQTKLTKRRKMYECIFNYLHRWTMPVFMTSDTCPRIFNELSNSITRCFLCLFSHMIVVEMQIFWRREQHVFIILQLYCRILNVMIRKCIYENRGEQKAKNFNFNFKSHYISYINMYLSAMLYL